MLLRGGKAAFVQENLHDVQQKSEKVWGTEGGRSELSELSEKLNVVPCNVWR